MLPVLFGCFVAEVALRLAGYTAEVGVTTGQIAGYYSPDEVTGWRLTERHAKAPEDPFTVWKGGRRATSFKDPFGDTGYPESGPKNLIFIGCSFVQGAERDEYSLPWMTQERLKEFVVTNYGTGGQGGCQSLMRIKDLIQTKGIKDATYIFGFFLAQESRNVADPVYAWKLARASQFRSAFMPYCGLTLDGQLEFKPAEVFDFEVPFSRKLALARLVEEVYHHIKALPRRKNQRSVTESILREMNDTVRSSGGRLIVLSMRFDKSSTEHYSKFCAEEGIEFIDGSHPEQDEPSMQIGDGHPNAEMNSYWAGLIENKFRNLVVE